MTQDTWRATTRTDPGLTARLRCAIVLKVQEEACQVFLRGQRSQVRYATIFPSPRIERVSPGHLVAVATARDGVDAVVWRWYDAVVLGDDGDLVRLWEPAHGEVLARPRRADQLLQPGSRAYLSAGLPGADWWIAGLAADRAEDADVELDEVERFRTEHDLWNQLE